MYRKLTIASFCITTSLLILSPLANAENRIELRATIVQTNQETRITNREERKENREEFKAKLAELKDENKKEVVERIDTRLTTLNTNMTDHFNKVLARLTEILNKIETRTNTAKTNGKDTSAVEAAIVSARTAISTAQAAVTTQKGKTYVITINTESTLRSDVSTVVQSLRTDLKALKEVVQSARKAVISAAVAFGHAMGTVTPTP